MSPDPTTLAQTPRESNRQKPWRSISPAFRICRFESQFQNVLPQMVSFLPKAPTASAFGFWLLGSALSLLPTAQSRAWGREPSLVPAWASTLTPPWAHSFPFCDKELNGKPLSSLLDLLTSLPKQPSPHQSHGATLSLLLSPLGIQASLSRLPSHHPCSSDSTPEPGFTCLITDLNPRGRPCMSTTSPVTPSPHLAAVSLVPSFRWSCLGHLLP